MAQVREPLQVARLGQDDAAVHHRRLDDHPGDLVAMFLERLPGRRQVVERHHDHEVGERLRDPRRLRQRDGMIARAHQLGVGDHAEHQRVVVAVVGPLDLDEEVAPGLRAHQPGRLERRLGPRVAEPPQREREAFREVRADRVQVLRRLREMRPVPHLAFDRLDDRGMRVTDDHRAVTEVVVDVLVAVDVPDAAAVAALDEDRVRRRGLPGGGDAAGDVAPRDLPIRDRGPVLRLELGLLLLDQTVDPVAGRSRPTREPPWPRSSCVCVFERPFNHGRGHRARQGLRRPTGTIALERGGRSSSGQSTRLWSWGLGVRVPSVTRSPEVRLLDCAGPLAQSGRATDS